MSITLRQGTITINDPDGTQKKIDVITDTSKQEALAEFDTAKNQSIASINSAGANQINAITTKGTETLASIPADYSQLSESINDIYDDIKPSESGNLFNFEKRLENTDIVTSNGELKSDNRYYASNKIYLDLDKEISVAGTSYAYVYCYGENDAFIGRYQISTPAKVSSFAPTTKYIRLLAKTGEDGMSIAYSDTTIKSKMPYIFDVAVNKPIKFRLETYNVGDFTGKNNVTRYDYRRAIAEGNADIICFQEDVPYAFGDNPEVSLYGMYQNKQRFGNSNYNYKTIVTNKHIKSTKQVFYTGDHVYDHTWFMVAVILVDGVEVAVANVHLDWRDKGWRRLQLRQVINYMSKYNNALICGDFNPEDRTNGSWNVENQLCYIEDWQWLTDGGYEWGNAGYFDVYDTIADTHPSGEPIYGPWDSIFVKGDIKIQNAYIREYPYMNDHKIFGCDLVIY